MAGFKRKALAEADRRITAATLAELVDAQVDVFCWCNRCGHNALAPSAGLAARLGADFPVPEIGARLRCSACGGKDVATRPAWPGPGPIVRHG